MASELTKKSCETKACETNSGDLTAFSQACQELKQIMQQAETKISAENDAARQNTIKSIIVDAFLIFSKLLGPQESFDAIFTAQQTFVRKNQDRAFEDAKV